VVTLSKGSFPIFIGKMNDHAWDTKDRVSILAKETIDITNLAIADALHPPAHC